MRIIPAMCLLAGLTSCYDDGLTHDQRSRDAAEAYAKADVAQFHQTPEQAKAIEDDNARVAAIAAAWRKAHPKSMAQEMADAAEHEAWAAEIDAQTEAREACLAAVSTEAGILACTR